MKILLSFVFAAALTFAQTAQYPGAVATDANLAVARNRVQTTLSQAMAVSDTTVSLTSTSGIVVNMLLSVDAEIVLVTSVSPSSVTVTRAFDSTAATTHAARAVVSANLDAWHHNAVTAEVKAIESALGVNLANTATGAPAASYNFAAQTPGGSLIAGVNAITMTPVPRGVNGADANHYLYISAGTGTAEACLISGGTGTGGAASGSIILTCANTHTGAWTVQSASAGIREAIVAQNFAGSVYVGCGNSALYASLYVPRTISVNGSGECSVILWQGATTGTALISGDTSTNDTLEYLGVVSNLEIVNGVAAGTTVGVLAGGDPTSVRASSALLGGRVTFDHVMIQGFNTQLLYGTNAYNRTWQDVRFDGNSLGSFGVQFGVPGTGAGGNSGTHEVFEACKLIGALTAAFQVNASMSVTFTGTRIEYNRRGFYLNDSVGSVITWVGGHMETWSDNAASSHCASVNLCGPFIEFQAVSNLTLTMIGGDYFYSDPAVVATNYFNFNNVFRIGLNVEGMALGAATGTTVTNAFNISSTDPTNSSVAIKLLHYAQGFEPSLTKIVNSSTLTNWSIEDINGARCTNCANPTTAAIVFAKLPTCSASLEGRLIAVSDGSVATWGTALAGAGANHVAAYCNGTAWTVGAK